MMYLTRLIFFANRYLTPHSTRRILPYNNNRNSFLALISNHVPLFYSYESHMHTQTLYNLQMNRCMDRCFTRSLVVTLGSDSSNNVLGTSLK